MTGQTLADTSTTEDPRPDPGLGTYLSGLTFLTILVMVALVLLKGEEGPTASTLRSLFLDSPKSAYLVCGHDGVTDEDGHALEALQVRFESANLSGRTRVESLFAETITRKALLSGVRRLAESGEPRGMLFWVYAGPVRVQEGGELFLSAPDEPLALAEVVRTLETSRASRIILLIDGRQVDIHEVDLDSSEVAAANGLTGSTRQHLIVHVSASSRGMIPALLEGLDGAADGQTVSDGWVTLEELGRHLEAGFEKDPDPLSLLVRHHGGFRDFYLSMRPSKDPEPGAGIEPGDASDRPRAARAETGRLHIETDPPGAELFLAQTGQPLGSSPADVELPAGWHQILARGSPSYEEARQEVHVVPGSSMTMRLFLSPLGGAAKPADSLDAPAAALALPEEAPPPLDMAAAASLAIRRPGETRRQANKRRIRELLDQFRTRNHR